MHATRSEETPGLEDADGNYEYLAGKTPACGTEDGPDARPSSFGGIIELPE